MEGVRIWNSRPMFCSFTISANCYYMDPLCYYRNRFAFMTLIIIFKRVLTKFPLKLPRFYQGEWNELVYPLRQINPREITGTTKEWKSQELSHSDSQTLCISCLPTPTTDSKLIPYRLLILIFFHSVIRIFYCIVC